MRKSTSKCISLAEKRDGKTEKKVNYNSNILWFWFNPDRVTNHLKH